MVCCRCKQLSLAIAGLAMSFAVLLQGFEDATPRRLEPEFAPGQQPSNDDRKPRFERVGGDIETFWQPPHEGTLVQGILFMAHGCNHQATDFFADTGPDGWKLEACHGSRFGRCLGLPEERQLVQEARARGYYVAAVSGTGSSRCWSHKADPSRVRQALQHIRMQEKLSEDVPILATGASSGGAFMSSLALALERPPKCVVPQISALASSYGSLETFAAMHVPTLFVHMSEHDPRTAMNVDKQVKELESKGVLAKQLHVAPVPLGEELVPHFGKKQASIVEAALQQAGLVQADGRLKQDPRASAWRQAPGLRAFMAATNDTLVADESSLSELLNVVWARHEFTAKFASQMLDFCEGKPLV